MYTILVLFVVAVSPTFLSWVINFGSKAKVILPQSVMDKICSLAYAAIEQYSNTAEVNNLLNR